MGQNNTIPDHTNFTTRPGVPDNQKLTADEFNALNNGSALNANAAAAINWREFI